VRADAVARGRPQVLGPSEVCLWSRASNRGARIERSRKRIMHTTCGYLASYRTRRRAWRGRVAFSCPSPHPATLRGLSRVHLRRDGRRVWYMLGRFCVLRLGLTKMGLAVALALASTIPTAPGCTGSTLHLAAQDSAPRNPGAGGNPSAGGNPGMGGVSAGGGTTDGGFLFRGGGGAPGPETTSDGGFLFTGGGGAPGFGGSSTVCLPPPCAAPACGDGYVVASSNTCDCSGPCGCPCGCWTCAPTSQPGTGGVISSGGTSGSSGIGEATSYGGVSGRSGGAPLQHRSTSASCPTQRGPGPPGQPYPYASACAATGCPSAFATTCASDSECTAGVNGRCFPFEGLVGPGGCSYDECFTDSNCGSKIPCLCRISSTDNSANVCDVAGNCAVDSDCGPGGYCSPSVQIVPNQPPNVCWGSAPYYCHTASDLCINDSDCAPLDAGPPTPSSPTYTCAYNPQGNRWECTQAVCALP
jgi:hypothetical protein